MDYFYCTRVKRSSEDGSRREVRGTPVSIVHVGTYQNDLGRSLATPKIGSVQVSRLACYVTILAITMGQSIGRDDAALNRTFKE